MASDLVKRLRGMEWGPSGARYTHSCITEAADRIEALEAAAAQPLNAEMTTECPFQPAMTKREAALVRALEEIADERFCAGDWMVEVARKALAYDTPATPDAGRANPRGLLLADEREPDPADEYATRFDNKCRP